jgi:signal peptidase I
VSELPETGAPRGASPGVPAPPEHPEDRSAGPHRPEPGSRADAGAESGADGGEHGGHGPIGVLLAGIREIVIVLVIALGLSLLIKTFLVQAFFIPSPSMESTLIDGDRVLVNKLDPGPLHLKRGDIVVFSDPGGWLDPVPPSNDGPFKAGIRTTLTFVGLLPEDSDQHLIKRLIGMPGDKVACCDSKGRITVNGVGLDEPYLYSGDDPSDVKFSITVPAGRIWVMGDHRSVSEDSRYHLQSSSGTVPVDDVVGTAFVRVWPLNRFALLRFPTSTYRKVPSP